MGQNLGNIHIFHDLHGYAVCQAIREYQTIAFTWLLYSTFSFTPPSSMLDRLCFHLIILPVVYGSVPPELGARGRIARSFSPSYLFFSFYRLDHLLVFDGHSGFEEGISKQQTR